MLNLRPKGGDGAYNSDAPLRLGEIYCFTTSSKQISLDHAMPQRWYGMVEAYLVGSTQKETELVVQMLPDLSTRIQLSLQQVMQLLDDKLLHLKHFASSSLNTPYASLKHMLISTQEHSHLLAQDPELLSEWKLLCLYEHSDQRVKLTYEWMTSQEWFDIDPCTIDWTLLSYQLLDLVNQPNDDDYDETGGSFPIQA